ncbi:MAG: insulinase family protein [Bacteroidetes bacterium]|nr:insulinase family protein [Bacteroidota bacterium]
MPPLPRYKRCTAALALSLVFICTLVWGQPLPMDPRLLHGRLDNGLTYYIRENQKPEKKVELRLVVRVGSIMEDDDQQGLAHMAEHMAFNGTKNFKKNEIISFLQDIGVGFGNDLNAYTSFDETVYILPIPSDKPGNIEKGFQVLEDWAHQVTYLDEDIDSERAIILEESRLGKSGEERMFNKIYPELFKGSRYADRLPIGKDSIIQHFPKEAIRRFYRDWYRPDLMAVVVVGDISKDKALDMVRKHFSGLRNPQTPRPRTYASVPPYQASNAMVVTDPEATSFEFGLNYPARPSTTASTLEEYRSLQVKNLYTSMLNSRLRELTQRENPAFVNAYASFDSYAGRHEAFNVYTSTGTSDIRKGYDSVLEEIERVKRFGFTGQELDRARKNVMASLERTFNDRDKTESSRFADEYIRHFTVGESIPGIEKEFDIAKTMLPAISLEEVNRVTDAFRKDTAVFAYVMGPTALQTGGTLPTASQILSSLGTKAKASLEPWKEKILASSLLAESPKAGRIVKRSTDKLLGTTELTLSNGITVTLRPTDFKNDQILLNVSREGGFGGYPLTDKYNAENAASLTSAMGFGAFSPTDLRKALAGKSVSVSPFISQSNEGFLGSAVRKDLEALFQLLWMTATSPRRDSSLFKSSIQRSKAQYLMLGSNPQIAFIDTTYAVLFRNDPRTATVVPKAANYDKVDLERCLTIYRERLTDLTGMHLILVGSFQVDSLLPYLQTYVASLPASGKKTSAKDNGLRPIQQQQRFDFRRGKEDKSLVLGIYAGEMPYSTQTARKLNALSEILNILIIEEMREKIQGIYGGGTQASMDRLPYPTFQLVLQLPCGPTKVDTLLQEFQRELKLMAEKGPDVKYLDKVKKQWLEGYRTDIKTNEYWLGKLNQLHARETTTDQFLNWGKYVQALTTADIQEAARMVLKAPTQLTAVQMPEK